MSVCPCLQPRFPRVRQPLLLSMGLLLSAWLAVSPAQVSTNITPDSTLRTTVTQDGRVHTIAGGTMRGSSLFHSFDRFNVGTRDTASFTSMQTGIENILSRVTGGHPSHIDGILQSKIPGANLYLLNPSGVLFGPDARLDVSGSFHVSTADFLRLGRDGIFHASLPHESMLTMAPPSAFGFLGPNPARISVQRSALRVPRDETLSVISGDIAIEGGSLEAPSGQLHLASVASAGEVPLSAPDQSPDLRVESFERLGRIAIANGAFIHASADVVPTEGDGSGTVVIRGGRLLIDNSFISATAGDVNGATTGIDIQVAKTMVVTGGGEISAFVPGAGSAGDIRITAGSLALSNRAAIDSESSFASEGATGDITITTDILQVQDGSRISTNSQGTGHSGDIRVETGQLTVTGRSRIDSTASTSAGGMITVQATEAVNLDDGQISSFTFGSSRSGDIVVETGRLTLTGGSQIDSSSRGFFFSRGQGGDITVTATEMITITGRNSSGSRSGLVSLAASLGDAGSIVVSAPTLSLDEGGVIQTSALVGGRAGDITLEVGRLSLLGGAFIDSSTAGTGPAGTLTIRATDSITIAGRDSDGLSSSLSSASISENVFPPDISGDAGDIIISAPTLTIDGGTILNFVVDDSSAGDIIMEVGRLTLTGDAFISSSSFLGRGGTVTIKATDVVSISESSILSEVILSGQAGEIFISAPTLTMDGGIIATETFAEGRAGNIVVDVGNLTLMAGAQIESGTLTSVGPGGTITVMATDTVTIAGRNREGTPSGLFTNAAGEGPGGDIVLQARHVQLTDGARISAESTGAGNAGNISLTATQTFRSTNSAVTTAATRGAAGGDITVEAQTLVELQASDITASVAGGVRPGGDITIHVPVLNIEGGTIQATTAGQGRGGEITVAVSQLTLTERAQIDSSTSGTGEGGMMTVTATDTVVLTGSNSGLSTRATGQGKGGEITLKARDIQLTDGASIAANSTGIGNAGNIRLTANETFLSKNSDVTTAADAADGGNITLEARLVRLIDSDLTAAARGAEPRSSDGGNVTIRAGFVILENSQIQANAFGGNGGNITIEVENAFLADTETCADQECLNASSQLGVPGTVEVSSPTADLSGVVAPLPQTFTQAAALLPQRCAERLQGQPVSTFVLAGRDRVPAKPGAMLPSPLYRAEREIAASTERTDTLPLSAARAAERLVYTISHSELGLACAK